MEFLAIGCKPPLKEQTVELTRFFNPVHSRVEMPTEYL